MSVKVIVRSLPVQWVPEFHFTPAIGHSLWLSLRLSLHLLKPLSMAFFLLALWRFAADLGWTEEFLISDGVFSHWQVWGAMGLAILGLQAEFEKRDLQNT